jgi:AcrR family transcriptional regulator
MKPSTDSTSRRPPARERLLEAATSAFYREGIRTTPVDRVIAEAGVTRATFYRHFRSKEELVVAYVQEWDRSFRAQIAAAAEGVDGPEGLLRVFVDGIAEEVCRSGFRGCPFINAAAEYSDPEHPVRRAVETYRTWFHEVLAETLSAAGHPEPEQGAHTLALLRDGAMVAGYLETPGTVRARLSRAVEGLLPKG